MALHRFYWLVEDTLAGCSRPGGIARQREASLPPEEVTRQLDEDLAWLRDRGIGAVLTLTETPLDLDALERHGLATLHLPVEDLTPPTPEQLDLALRFIDEQRLQGRPVAVHCLMGQGRTGSVLAAYLIRAGATPEAALRELRSLCPGAVENPSQENALQAYFRRRDWII
jgi:atypical dual specificity phosphatase